MISFSGSSIVSAGVFIYAFFQPSGSVTETEWCSLRQTVGGLATGLEAFGGASEEQPIKTAIANIAAASGRKCLSLSGTNISNCERECLAYSEPSTRTIFPTAITR